MHKKEFFHKAVIILLFSMSISLCDAHTIIVMDNSGQITQYPIDESGKLAFLDDNIIIKSNINDKSGVTLPLAFIKKISFGGDTDVTDVDNASSALSVYPNPTSDYVFVSHAEEGDNVEVYSWNGMLLGEQKYSDRTGVSLKSFPTGLYIVRLNGQSYKINKK